MYNTLIKGVARCRCKRANRQCMCSPCTCVDPTQGLALMQARSARDISRDGVPRGREMVCHVEGRVRRGQEMAQRGLRPDTITINTLLDSHCCAGQITQECAEM